MQGGSVVEPILVITEQSDFKTWRKGIGFGIRRHPAIWFLYAIFASFVIWQFAGLVQSILSGEYAWHGVIPPLFILSLLLVFLFVVVPRLLYRSNASVTTSWFYEDRFAYSSVRRDVTLSATKSYDQVRKAYETKDLFYLKCGKDGAFQPKSRLTDDQIEALRDLFTRKFGERFKTREE